MYNVTAETDRERKQGGNLFIFVLLKHFAPRYRFEIKLKCEGYLRVAIAVIAYRTYFPWANAYNCLSHPRNVVWQLLECSPEKHFCLHGQSLICKFATLHAGERKCWEDQVKNHRRSQRRRSVLTPLHVFMLFINALGIQHLVKEDHCRVYTIL